jgi:hypothetical protein
MKDDWQGFEIWKLLDKATEPGREKHSRIYKGRRALHEGTTYTDRIQVEKQFTLHGLCRCALRGRIYEQ